MRDFISLDEAFEQEFLDDLRNEEFEGVLHETEYVDEIPMSDALDAFLRQHCDEEPEDEFERVCGIWYKKMERIYPFHFLNLECI